MHENPLKFKHPKDVSTLIDAIAHEYELRGQQKTCAVEERPYLGKVVISEVLERAALLRLDFDVQGLRTLCQSPEGDRVLTPLLNSYAKAYTKDFVSDSTEWPALQEKMLKFFELNAFSRFSDCPQVTHDLFDIFQEVEDLPMAEDVVFSLLTRFSGLMELCEDVDEGYQKKITPRSLKHEINGVRAVIEGALSFLPNKKTSQHRVDPAKYIFIEDDLRHPFTKVLERVEGLTPFCFEVGRYGTEGHKHQLVRAEDFIKYLQLERGAPPNVVICDINLGRGNMTGIDLAERLHHIYGVQRPFKLIIYSKDVENRAIKRELENLLREGKIDGFTPKESGVLAENVAKILNSDSDLSTASMIFPAK